ncbi:MAG: ATP-binding protein [Myxococcaceae bacterium]|nr:ATP-binding protein [Myxococcaceae bacterium]
MEIKNLRGIREGALHKLTPLTVLVGPNSSGKSTILDALLIGASPSPGDAVGRAVGRRSTRDADARWLLWRQGQEGSTTVGVETEFDYSRYSTLSWSSEVPSELTARLREVGGAPPFSCIETRCRGALRGVTATAWTAFAVDNSYEFKQSPEVLPTPLKFEPGVSFIDMRGVGLGTPLAQLYSESVTQGRRDDVRELLGAVVPGLRNLEILVNHRLEPVLHLVFSDKSVPVALAGDGVRTMLRLGLELASRSKGLVLIEEPEVHQHPKALQQSARALLAGMRRGIQIVLATHSLELIDALLLEASQEDLPRISTYRLKLEEGTLASSRIDGERMAFARGQIEEDLR